jgi:hypothetical protein
MRAAALEQEAEAQTRTCWAMHLDAIALEDSDRLMLRLTDVIAGCGGRILSRAASDTGNMALLFEFERLACVDIYSGLVGAGVEFSSTGHLRFTELCQCTHSGPSDCTSEIVSIDLEIRTYRTEHATRGPRAA